MTELLYLKDCYLKEFDATVLDSGKTSEHEFFIVLDKTAFYPEGGGQMSDTGFLEFNGEKFEVFKVSKHRNQVKHWLKKEILKNSKVHGVINWENRYLQMRVSLML